MIHLLPGTRINISVKAVILILGLIAFIASTAEAQKKNKQTQPPDDSFYDSHFHLTNYIQEGTDIHKYLEIMGNRVGRSTLFGIPLQQMWAYHNSGSFAPTYYLQSDAPLYYYSFTDAYIASAYNSLSETEKQRFDPMITGFNPADMYAKEHVKRVLQTFPGVFSGIGEFSIHKEFVSAKVAGEAASLANPALDSLLQFAGEVGLVVLIHNDMDMPFAKAGTEPVYLDQIKELFKRHPKTTIIWAHIGLGRVVHPVQPSASEPIGERNQSYLQIVEGILKDSGLRHVHFDISWDEVAKYLSYTPQSLTNTVTIISRYPDRFLFGTDVVAPTSPEMYYAVYAKYDALWKNLSPEVSQKLRKGNYERIFNEARQKVRNWEKMHASTGSKK
ncbi:amidohydrolase family protein [Pontibacter ruber]|uniref:Amidohydrolase family protein n=1 Tax=Pontibacter ruber TaxID=1343895 RepID=A0ABW5CYZ4_9BACT|nr:amidohydrolase family protein [Pontibacter ruber]